MLSLDTARLLCLWWAYWPLSQDYRDPVDIFVYDSEPPLSDRFLCSLDYANDLEMLSVYAPLFWTSSSQAERWGAKSRVLFRRQNGLRPKMDQFHEALLLPIFRYVETGTVLEFYIPLWTFWNFSHPDFRAPRDNAV